MVADAVSTIFVDPVAVLELLAGASDTELKKRVALDVLLVVVGLQEAAAVGLAVCKAVPEPAAAGCQVAADYVSFAHEHMIVDVATVNKAAPAASTAAETFRAASAAASIIVAAYVPLSLSLAATSAVTAATSGVVAAVSDVAASPISATVFAAASAPALSDWGAEASQPHPVT
ncbi:hypothetical protein Droror1_Dr00017868 [Drosera rotundifolia]